MDLGPALAALGLVRSVDARPCGGATGRTWRLTVDGRLASLRLLAPRTATTEIAAMAAAGAAGLPVPEVIACARAGDETTALLVTWLPGRPGTDLLERPDNDVRAAGRAFGTAQRAPHDVPAPASLAAATTWHGAVLADLDLPTGSALLHLDYHPLNALFAGTRLAGIIDWTNARAGSPWLDLARTATVLTLDPGVEALGGRRRHAAATFQAGWLEGYDVQEADIPADCLTWAARVMLADLGPRYPADSDALAPIKEWLRGRAQPGKG